MTPSSTFEIAVLPGDGIGVEVTSAAVEVLDALSAEIGGIRFNWRHYPGGAQAYRDTGVALADETMKALEQADAILFGAMGLPDIRYPDGTEIAPQLDIRVGLDLYAGVRPIRAMTGLPCPLSDPRAAGIDFVLIREQTEGLFFARGRGQVIDDAEARDTMRITRQGSERVFSFALRLAERRKKRGRPGRVTCVDKANVFASMAFFRRIFDEQARRFPAVAADHCYIDAMALNLVRHPWSYDVIVTENMFGDILSDLGGRADRRHGHGPVRRRGRPARALSARARVGPGHRRDRQGQPHGHVPVGRDDAGVARGAPRAAGLQRRRRPAPQRGRTALSARSRQTV
jgi:3-isopropylmalate dehydrogenase